MMARLAYTRGPSGPMPSVAQPAGISLPIGSPQCSWNRLRPALRRTTSPTSRSSVDLLTGGSGRRGVGQTRPLEVQREARQLGVLAVHPEPLQRERIVGGLDGPVDRGDRGQETGFADHVLDR